MLLRVEAWGGVQERHGFDKKREGDRRSGCGPGGSSLLICPPKGGRRDGATRRRSGGRFKRLLTAKVGFPRDCGQFVFWLCLLCRICGGGARAIRPRRRGWGCGPGWLILAGRRGRAGGMGGSGKSGGLSQDGGRVFPRPFSAPSQTWGGGKEGGGIWNAGQEIIRDPFLGFQNFKFFLCVMLRGKCGMVLVGGSMTGCPEKVPDRPHKPEDAGVRYVRIQGCKSQWY